MKFLKFLLILLFTIMLLILGIFAAGALNPNLSDKLADLLYGQDKAASSHSEASVPAVTDNERDMTLDEILKGESSGSDPYSLSDDSSPDNSQETGIADIIPSYNPPASEALDVAPEMASRTGYEIPKGEDRSVEEPEAQSIEDELGYGETGEGLDFDSLAYPYYHMLDEDGKSLYRQIYANANALINRFQPIIKCTPAKVKNVFEAVIGDHPELFWLNTSYSTLTRPTGQVVEIDLSFNKTADNLDASKQEFNESAEAILQTARSLGSDFEKEKYVHDALADKIDYSMSAPMNQSAYSALVYGSTVCAGYARAMQYLMQQLNIPCYYCTGYAGENHAWNIIKLDDDFYNVDVTWDDSSKGNYDYFNKSDSVFNRDHIRKNLSVYLPACNGENYQVESVKDMPGYEDAGNEEQSLDNNSQDQYIFIYQY